FRRWERLSRNCSSVTSGEPFMRTMPVTLTTCLSSVARGTTTTSPALRRSISAWVKPACVSSIRSSSERLICAEADTPLTTRNRQTRNDQRRKAIVERLYGKQGDFVTLNPTIQPLLTSDL